MRTDGQSLVTLATYKTKLTSLQMDASNVLAVERMEVDEETDAIIPCIATRPDVTVSYSHHTFASENLVDENEPKLYRNIEVYNTCSNIYILYIYIYCLNCYSRQRIQNTSSVTI